MNINPRANIVQGRNRPLNGNPIGSGAFNRTNITKGFQDDHIASNTNKRTKNHEAFALAGMSMNARANKIYLPTNHSLHETRSIHKGRHTNSYSQETERRQIGSSS